MIVHRSGEGGTAFATESGLLPFCKDTLDAVPQDAGIFLFLDERGKILYIGSARLPLGLASCIEAQYNTNHWPEVTHFKWAATRDRINPERLAENLVQRFNPPFNRPVLEAMAS